MLSSPQFMHLMILLLLTINKSVDTGGYFIGDIENDLSRYD
jgi:hypothetical protein